MRGVPMLSVIITCLLRVRGRVGLRRRLRVRVRVRLRPRLRVS